MQHADPPGPITRAIILPDDLDCFHAARISVVGMDPSQLGSHQIHAHHTPGSIQGWPKTWRRPPNPKALAPPERLSLSGPWEITGTKSIPDWAISCIALDALSVHRNSATKLMATMYLRFTQVTGPTCLSPGVDQGNVLVLIDDGSGLFIRSRLLPPDGSTCGAV